MDLLACSGLLHKQVVWYIVFTLNEQQFGNIYAKFRLKYLVAVVH